jgi:hypothetical protein
MRRSVLALSLSIGLLGLAAAGSSEAQTLVQNRRPVRRPVRRPPRTPPPPPAQVVDDENVIAHAVPLPAATPPSPQAARALATPPPSPPEPAPEWRYPGLDVSVGGRVFSRSLSWDNDTAQALRPYDLSAAPALRVAAELFPGALTDSRVGRLVGAVVHFDTAVGLSTVDARGRSYDTSAWSLLAGLKVRAPFETERHELALVVAYRRQEFAVRGEGDAPVNGAPDLTYQSLQAGLASRWALSRRVAISLDAAYLAVLATGQLGDVFPHVGTHGVDVVAGVAVALAAGVEVRAGGEFRSYFHSFNPERGDRYQLTGATDQQFGGWLAVALRR